MNSLTKLAVCAMAFAGITLASAETFNLADKNFFRKNMGNFSTTGTQFTTKGMTYLASRKTFDIDPEKSYKFKMTITNSAPKPLRLYIGFNLVDAKGRTHSAIAWQGIASTFTQIARDAKKGDKVLYVKNATYWSVAGTVNIARNAKQDATDVPNTTIVANSIKAKKKIGNEWEVTLREPLKADFKAGENVRQHIAGGFYYSVTKLVDPSEKEIVIDRTVKGYVKTLNGFNGKNWPIGAKKAQFIILADWGSKVGTPLIFKNASFSVE